MPVHARSALLANVSCAATDAFANCKNYRELVPELLTNTYTFYKEISEWHSRKTTEPLQPLAGSGWIMFDNVKTAAPKAKAKAAGPSAKLLPKVITYDEDTGKPLSWQKQRDSTTTGAAAAAAIVPWPEWLASAAAKDFVKQNADMAAITHVLHSMHCRGGVHTQGVVVLLEGASQKCTAVAVDDMAEFTVHLPPCVPRGKAVRESSHPHKVAIMVETNVSKETALQRAAVKQNKPVPDASPTAIAPTKEQQPASTPETLNLPQDSETVTTYYVIPEFKLPEDVTEQGGREVDAVASAAKHVHGKRQYQRIWKWNGDETMHPSWAVARLSESELRKKNSASGGNQVFNMGLVPKQFNVVTVGTINDQSVACTVAVTVPILTNTRNVRAGEELIMRATCKEKDQKRKPQTWKDDVAKQETPTKRPKVAQPNDAVLEV